jgi:ABC-type sugar transport system permease subunit
MQMELTKKRLAHIHVSYRMKTAIWGFLFALPAVGFLLVFSIFPMFRAISISFTKYDMAHPAVFVGLKNYVDLLTSTDFINSLKVSVVYVFGTVVPVWFLSFFLALMLSKIRLFSGPIRTLLFLPTVLPLLTVTLVWKLFFHYRGVMNGLLNFFHIASIGWLTRSEFAPLALIITSWWHAPSYYMILFLAGLQAVPAVYDEAAQLDGASSLQRLWYITLPIIRPTIVLVVVLSIINGFRTFAIQQVMTGGGPGNATEIMTLLIYKTAFNFGAMGQATAMSVVYFLMILIFSLLQLRALRGGEKDG